MKEPKTSPMPVSLPRLSKDLQPKEQAAVYTFSSHEELKEVARKLSLEAEKKPCLLFKGPLGSGKTTLIATICLFLGVKTPVTSPTFGLIHHYEGHFSKNNSAHAIDIWHADLYRLRNEKELHALGFSELVEQTYDTTDPPQRLGFVEWADRFPSFFPAPQHWLDLQYIDRHTRRLVLSTKA